MGGLRRVRTYGKESLSWLLTRRYTGATVRYVRSDMERLMTAEEVQDVFQVSRQTIWRWRRDGILPAVQIGRSVRFRRSDVEKLFEPDSRRQPSSPQPADELGTGACPHLSPLSQGGSASSPEDGPPAGNGGGTAPPPFAPDYELIGPLAEFIGMPAPPKGGDAFAEDWDAE